MKKAVPHHHKPAKKPGKKAARKKTHKPADVLPSHTENSGTMESGVKSATLAPMKQEPQAMSLANAAAPVRTVSYNFCLGYDNCVPHKYEAVLQGNRVATSRVLAQSSDGNWAEAKIDPVMQGDLEKMAALEPGSGNSRELTAQEKAHIAAHQGKIHAELVGDANAGPSGKEQAKTLLRELGINNFAALDAYDPKLARNPVVVGAVNELADERARGPASQAD